MIYFHDDRKMCGRRKYKIRAQLKVVNSPILRIIDALVKKVNACKKYVHAKTELTKFCLVQMLAKYKIHEFAVS